MTAITLLDGPFGTWHSPLEPWQLLLTAVMFVAPFVGYLVVVVLREKRRN